MRLLSNTYGTKGIIKLRSEIPQDAFSRLNGREGDSFNITINDDLTGLLEFRAAFRGVEVDNG